jgi:hypothetical protein
MGQAIKSLIYTKIYSSKNAQLLSNRVIKNLTETEFMLEGLDFLMGYESYLQTTKA